MKWSSKIKAGHIQSTETTPRKEKGLFHVKNTANMKSQGTTVLQVTSMTSIIQNELTESKPGEMKNTTLNKETTKIIEISQTREHTRGPSTQIGKTEAVTVVKSTGCLSEGITRYIEMKNISTRMKEGSKIIRGTLHQNHLIVSIYNQGDPKTVLQATNQV